MKFRYSGKTRHTYRFIDNTTVFLDIVGFTKLGDNDEMRRAIQELHNVIATVLTRLEWDLEDKDNDVIMIPSGDGYGIAFCDEIQDEEILEYVVKLYKGITRSMKIRIGVSKGPNVVFQDLNDKLNIIGWGINRAQRVMTVAEENQILCDASFAEHFLKVKKGDGLIKVGKAKVKHGEELTIYNFYKEEGIGNKTTPSMISKDI